jgi:hypothetical protein
MRKLILGLMLFVSVQAHAASCLMDFNIATYAPEYVCVDAYGWQAEFTNSVECWSSSCQEMGNNMVAGCGAAFGGQYFPSSDDCGGAGALNAHLGHSCGR